MDHGAPSLLRLMTPSGDVMMDFGSTNNAVILGLIVIVILLGSVLWRLHSAADTISKGRRFY